MGKDHDLTALASKPQLGDRWATSATYSFIHRLELDLDLSLGLGLDILRVRVRVWVRTYLGDDIQGTME